MIDSKAYWSVTGTLIAALFVWGGLNTYSRSRQSAGDAEAALKAQAIAAEAEAMMQATQMRPPMVAPQSETKPAVVVFKKVNTRPAASVSKRIVRPVTYKPVARTAVTARKAASVMKTAVRSKVIPRVLPRKVVKTKQVRNFASVPLTPVQQKKTKRITAR